MLTLTWGHTAHAPGLRDPVVVEILERTVGIFDIDPVLLGAEGHRRGETLPDQLVADHQVRDDPVTVTFPYPRANAPRKKFRVTLNVCDEVEKLLRGKWNKPLFCMGRNRWAYITSFGRGYCHFCKICQRQIGTHPSPLADKAPVALRPHPREILIRMVGGTRERG